LGLGGGQLWGAKFCYWTEVGGIIQLLPQHGEPNCICPGVVQRHGGTEAERAEGQDQFPEKRPAGGEGAAGSTKYVAFPW